MELGAIILSGGKSSRFGSDKGLASLNGKPLIDYSISLCRHFTKDILLSSNNQEYAKFGLAVVPDVYKNAGPMAGIFSSLQKSKHDINLILACDSPFVNQSIIESLLQEYQDEDVIIFQTADQRYHPLLGLYHQRILTDLQHSLEQGHYKLIELILSLHHKIIPLTERVETEKVFLNINYQKDLDNYTNGKH